MIKTLILSGGVSHDFDQSTAALIGLLNVNDISCTIETDLDAGLARLPACDVLIFNTLRWTMRNGERYAPMRPRWGYDTGPQLREGIAAHLGAGRGIVGMHAASICFDDWPEWRDILGAAWRWGASAHDAPRPARVSFAGDHPLVAGLADFTIFDEIYTGLDIAPGAVPLAWAVVEGEARSHPVLWARAVGGGHVIYDALGHDPRSILNPAHAELIVKGIRWSIGDTAQGATDHA